MLWGPTADAGATGSLWRSPYLPIPAGGMPASGLLRRFLSVPKLLFRFMFVHVNKRSDKLLFTIHESRAVRQPASSCVASACIIEKLPMLFILSTPRPAPADTAHAHATTDREEGPHHPSTGDTTDDGHTRCNHHHPQTNTHTQEI